MDRMNERYAPSMVAVPFDKLEQLIRTETMLLAMIAEYDRGKFRVISANTVNNAKAVLYDEYEEEETDA